MTASRSRQHGISLVEALVALAVMAFGMLGLVGLQSSMRMNADVAKQRSEAVRIAQEQIEAWRSFQSLADYDVNIVTSAAAAASAPGPSNATYTWSAEVLPAPSVLIPPLKSVVVSVGWTDRAGAIQSVSLATHIAGVAPELAGALGAPASGSPTNRPLGRHAAIPPGALDQGDGTSRFVPPGSTNIGWVFNNATGVIEQLCDAAFATCVPTNAFLLSGFVRFALTAIQPTPVDAETPPGPAVALGVDVNATVPISLTVNCFVSSPSSHVAYYCAVPVGPVCTTGAGTAQCWSGRSVITGLPIATVATPNPADLTTYRVCRYTPGQTPGNNGHPATYSLVLTSLANQNFLVIPAGDGTTAFSCPGDNTTTPYVDGGTTAHQPP